MPNITHMWSAYASQDMFHIIMEYCDGGNLLDFLKAQQPHAVTEPWLAKVVRLVFVSSYLLRHRLLIV